ncbi:MAG: Ig-like domain-containing protein [Candidatus Manganitrophus sp.]|nr:Ig-like domain-containing protein [Candidatus Manganitrophus sp.]WDT70460.1 MAG: Ig-like domain-containing protein [Candidatus Manganitrophus sp.]WDT82306.1 MAG: Ig-like domain-containing protein [Candidatus Manganitrophus sp.]
MIDRPCRIISKFLYALIFPAMIASFPAAAAIGPIGEAPGIVRTVPGENESEVAPTTPIIVEFTKQIDPRTVTAKTFRVEGAEGVVHYDPGTKSATWSPTRPLEPWKQYQAAVTGDIADLEGHPLPFSYRWTFTTRSAEETLLNIQQTTPTDNATHVPVATLISVTFNKPIEPTSLKPDSLVVVDEEKLEGIIAYEPVTQTVTFLPKSPLAYEERYTVILKEGIEDRAGNRLLTAESWSFTTEGPTMPLSQIHP